MSGTSRIALRSASKSVPPSASASMYAASTSFAEKSPTASGGRPRSSAARVIPGADGAQRSPYGLLSPLPFACCCCSLACLWAAAAAWAEALCWSNAAWAAAAAALACCSGEAARPLPFASVAAAAAAADAAAAPVSFSPPPPPEEEESALNPRENCGSGSLRCWAVASLAPWTVVSQLCEEFF